MLPQLGNCYRSCRHKFSFHSVCHDTGYSCSGLSKRNTRLLHCKFQCTSISLPRTNIILGWNCFNNNNNSHGNGNDHGVLCSKTGIFLPKHEVWKNESCVSTPDVGWGYSPDLPCFTCHYLFIAAITDPLYATGIGIYYGVFYFVHLSVLKKAYEGVDQHTPVHGDDQTTKNNQPPTVELDDKHIQIQPTDNEEVAIFNYKALMIVSLVFFVTICYQILITTFFYLSSN